MFDRGIRYYASQNGGNNFIFDKVTPVLKENDLLGAFRVVKITVDTVILQQEGQAEITLKLKKED